MKPKKQNIYIYSEIITWIILDLWTRNLNHRLPQKELLNANASFRKRSRFGLWPCAGRPDQHPRWTLTVQNVAFVISLNAQMSLKYPIFSKWPQATWQFLVPNSTTRYYPKGPTEAGAVHAHLRTALGPTGQRPSFQHLLRGISHQTSGHKFWHQKKSWEAVPKILVPKNGTFCCLTKDIWGLYKWVTLKWPGLPEHEHLVPSEAPGLRLPQQGVLPKAEPPQLGILLACQTAKRSEKMGLRTTPFKW